MIIWSLSEPCSLPVHLFSPLLQKPPSLRLPPSPVCAPAPLASKGERGHCNIQGEKYGGKGSLRGGDMYARYAFCLVFYGGVGEEGLFVLLPGDRTEGKGREVGGIKYRWRHRPSFNISPKFFLGLPCVVFLHGISVLRDWRDG
jgi:hypothetical protein